MNSLEQQLQGLINRMQEDADRVVSTWSNIGDALLRHQDSQNSILAEIAHICQQGLGRAQPQQVYAQQPQPVQNGVHTAAYIAPGYPTAAAQAAPQQYGVANGYDKGYYPDPQGYPQQPYQQNGVPSPETPISQVLKNLRRQPG